MVWDQALGGEDTVFIEEMTTGEVGAAVRAGKTTVIIPTGGVEQNGPNVVTGKHNYVVRVMAEATARKLGDALVAPVVAFTPEGRISPPTGHMLYPGTISVRQSTYRALLEDIAMSLKQHGFVDVVFIGDSGDAQAGAAQAARKLSARWRGDPARAHYVADYYWKDLYSHEFLAGEGVPVEPDPKIHSDFNYEAVLALVDPELIRAEERRSAGTFEVSGVSLEPLDKTTALARKLVEHRAELTAAAIRTARSGD